MNYLIARVIVVFCISALALLSGCSQLSISTPVRNPSATPEAAISQTSITVAPVKSTGEPRASSTSTPNYAPLGAMSPITISNVNQIKPLNILTNDYSDAVYNVAFSPDGKFLASSGANATLIIWNIGTGKPALSPENPGETGGGIAFSPDNMMFAAGGVVQPQLLCVPSFK